MQDMLHDPERVIDLDLIRCTENGALASVRASHERIDHDE